MKLIKKYKDYLITVSITVVIILSLFISKNIYPFGNNSLIWGDLYDQITAFYYYFYDAIKGSDSLLINFGSSGGTNFWGILTYYLMSPLSLLVLLVKREEIYLFLSVIIALKIVLCNITCQFMLKKLFKKMNSTLSILLSLLYGFSAYSISFYQIMPWIDAMYMLPIVLVGLKELLDNNKPRLYIISLILMIYFCFYISMMNIIWIFILAIFYIVNYSQKKEWGKKILSLGLTTLLSLGSALVIILPSYKQISISARMGYGLETLINSKLGPITDKIALFLFGPIIFIGLIFLIKNYKQNKKFLKFFIPSMILLLIPVMVEPVNKLLHFGSYASFTYRFGMITTLLLIVGAGHFFNQIKLNKYKYDFKSIITIIITLITTLILCFITYNYYGTFQEGINHLTLSRNRLLIILFMAMFGLAFITNFLNVILHKGFNKINLLLISLITVVHIGCNVVVYMGIDHEQEMQRDVYESLLLMEKDSYDDNNFRYKTYIKDIIMNSGDITRYNTLDHFSSVSDGHNQLMLKRLGYTSYWTKTFSNGGNLFTDRILGNMYILDDEEKDYYNYILSDKYGRFYLYQYTRDMAYGYLINHDITIDEKDNSFDISNKIYESITGQNDLFKTIEEYSTTNGRRKYTVKVRGKGYLYLELYKSLDNIVNTDIYGHYNIYINNELVKKEIFDDFDNGVIDLGIFEDEEVVIEVETLKDEPLEVFELAVLDIDKLNTFTDNNYSEFDIKFRENKININIESDQEKILFLPIAYNKGYKATLNGQKTEVLKIYDNFIGIKANKGQNTIKISFVPEYFRLSLVISIMMILGTAIIINTNLYQKILEVKWLQNMAKYVYLGLHAVVMVVIFLIPILLFLVSFIKHINI